MTAIQLVKLYCAATFFIGARMRSGAADLVGTMTPLLIALPCRAGFSATCAPDGRSDDE